MHWLTSYQIQIAGARVSLISIVVALGVLFVGFFLASRLAKRVRGHGRTVPADQKWRATLAQIVGYAVRIVVVTLALQIAGVNVGSLVAAGAVVAVGIGIAMQRVAENFVSGVILMAERSIREGDVIEFEGQMARVHHMGIRSTIVETTDNIEIIVPNGILAQTPVKNLTLNDPIYRLRVTVGVSYASDIALVEETLRRAAEGQAWRVQARKSVVQLQEFGPSSVDFEVSVWTEDAWGARACQSDLRKAIWFALQAARISIPFPQLDVHWQGHKDAS